MANSAVSEVNSTIIPLLANSSFTGVFEEVKDFAYLSFSIISDQTSAPNGLEFQWSSDGINIDRIETTNLLANTGRAFSIGIRARYFRVKYINGATNQTFFRLGTTYHPNGAGIITKPLKGSVTSENFAQLVQAPIMARLKDDNYINIAGIKLDSTGLLATADSDAIFADQGNTFFVTTDSLGTSGTSQQPFLLIRNPVGSGKILRIDSIVIGVPNIGSTLYRIYQSPTVTTNGTLLTPVGARQTSQSAPITNFYTGSTISSNGLLFFSTRIDAGSVPLVYEFDFAKILEPGFDMLLTVQPTAGGSTSIVNLQYSEL